MPVHIGEQFQMKLDLEKGIWVLTHGIRISYYSIGLDENLLNGLEQMMQFSLS